MCAKHGGRRPSLITSETLYLQSRNGLCNVFAKIEITVTQATVSSCVSVCMCGGLFNESLISREWPVTRIALKRHVPIMSIQTGAPQAAIVMQSPPTANEVSSHLVPSAEREAPLGHSSLLSQQLRIWAEIFMANEWSV